MHDEQLFDPADHPAEPMRIERIEISAEGSVHAVVNGQRHRTRYTIDQLPGAVDRHGQTQHAIGLVRWYMRGDFPR